MSNNVDHVNVLSSTMWMDAKDVVKLYKKYEDDLPESNFLYELIEDAEELVEKSPEERKMNLGDVFEWCGTGSGRRVSDLTEKIAPFIKGRGEIILTFECGSNDAYIFEDGKVIPCSVEFKLVPHEEKNK